MTQREVVAAQEICIVPMRDFPFEAAWREQNL
jgi:hypothetical protein